MREHDLSTMMDADDLTDSWGVARLTGIVVIGALVPYWRPTTVGAPLPQSPSAAWFY